jgi:hypothetical protein
VYVKGTGQSDTLQLDIPDRRCNVDPSKKCNTNQDCVNQSAGTVCVDICSGDPFCTP